MILFSNDIADCVFGWIRGTEDDLMWVRIQQVELLNRQILSIRLTPSERFYKFFSLIVLQKVVVCSYN